MDFAVFGCSLDALDAPEKVAMKRAYMEATARGVVGEGLTRDPYGLLLPRISRIHGMRPTGRLALEPWLEPRPGPGEEERVTVDAYREFLDSGGCARVAGMLEDFVAERILPSRPLMLGVDHSLTGGVVEALAAGGEGGGLFLVVLDSHFDAIPTGVRAGALEGSRADRMMLGDLPESYNCGTWIAGLLERRVVRPENLAVVGVSDHPGHAAGGTEGERIAEYREAYLGYERMGAGFVTKKDVREWGAANAAGAALENAAGKPVYVSFDADLGAGGMNAVRFLDTMGLAPGEIIELSLALNLSLAERGCRLAGIDVMEVDVHLADIPGTPDATADTCAGVVRALVTGETGGEPDG